MKKHLLFKVLALALLSVLSVTNAWADHEVFVDWNGKKPDWYSGALIHYWDGSSDQYVSLSSTSTTNVEKASISDSATGWRVCRKDGSGNRCNSGSWLGSSTNMLQVTSMDSKPENNGNGPTGTESEIIGLVESNHHIYFDNSVTGWSGVIQFVVGRSAYSKTYVMSQIEGTKFWYVKCPDTWKDATYYGFISSGEKYGDGSWGSSNMTTAPGYTAAYTSKYSLYSGNTYVCTPSAAANGSSFEISYKSSGYSAIASTYTHNLYVRTRTQLDGSTPSYGTSMNSPTTVNIKGYEITNNGTSTQQTSSVTTSGTNTSRGSIISTSTVSTDYSSLSGTSPWVFDGWAENTSGPASANSTYSIDNAKAAKSIYAYFSKRTYTVSFNMHSYGDAVSSQVKDYYALVTKPDDPTTESAYVFRGWWKESTYDNQWNFASDHVTATTTLHAKWLAYVNVAYNKGANGTGTNTSDKKVTGENLTLKGAIFTRTGYTQTGWSTTDGGAKSYNLGATYSTQSALTLYPFWTPNPYTVTLAPNGGSGNNQVVTATYDATMPSTLSDGETAIVAPTKTGYDFDGYWYESTQYYDESLNSVTNWNRASATTLNAKWDPKSYTVTLELEEDNYGDIDGKDKSASVTYDAAPTSIAAAKLPTAANGYCFMGFFTATAGGGVQVINANGTWISDVTGYMSNGNWVHDGDETLYAYYKVAEITNLALDAALVEYGNTVGVTPTVSPTPTGTTQICWEVQYAASGNPLSPQPSMTWSEGKLTFPAPSASGLYTIVATLKTGNDCAAGDELSTNNINFQVAGGHTVTVQYHDGSANSIKASTSVTGHPTEWSSSITAPDDIFGYIFEYWEAGDGIKLSKDGSSTHGYDTAKVATVYIKATYDGTLTAVYKPADILYFKNTMGWDNVYAYFYTSDLYWDNTYFGSGTDRNKEFRKQTGTDGEGNPTYDDHHKPYWDQKHGQLERLGSTDIWYIDFGALGCASWSNVVFNANQQDNYEWFSATEVVRRGDLSKGTPMFVPANRLTYDPTTKNSNAKYYNQGYWTKYLGNETGYTLEVYDASGTWLKSIPFTGDENLMPMTATTDLEGNTTYKFQLKRANDIYYGNSGTMNYADHGQGTPWAFTNGSPFPGLCSIISTAAGDYKFTLTYSQNARKEYELRIGVDYPISDGDYRLVYSDAIQTKELISAIVPHSANKDTIVSFFIRKAQSPVLRMQKATVAGDGSITWNEYPTSGSPVNQLTSAVLSTLPQDSVYNINLHIDGSSALSVTSVTPYEGNFYIRTDGVHNKWDNFRATDHLMTYSEYAEKNSGFTHYFMSHVYGGTNVKFVVANDYAPNISDTLVQQAGDEGHVDASGKLWYGASSEANIRFMWNRHDNSVSRAYLAAAKSDGSKFLVLRANASTDLMDEDGNALINSANSGQAGYNHKAPDNSMQFTDNENWIYETTVKVKPSAYVKLYAHYHGEDFYFKGEDNDDFDSSNAIQILGGSGDAEKLHVVYDFKTGRLVSAWMPSGTISDERKIYADVMFLREHQGDIEQLTFGEEGIISEINTAYAVMRFNKWTLNNKDKSTHLPLGTELSRFERDLFYVSFPFKVAMNEVFGFGTYGKHWIIEEYDGAGRAAKGFWADSESFWTFVTDRKGKYFEPNQGYIIALDLDELGESSSIWDNGVEQVELYFPSYGDMPNIKSASVTYEVPPHTCAIGPRPGMSDDRRIKDSHWNVISVPTYINTNSVSFANTTWMTAGDGQLGPNFLYTWNKYDNTLTPTAGAGYTYHAMHAYIVQYCGNITWTTSVSPATAPRRNPDAPKDVEYRLELSQNDQMIDQTFVRLSDDEKVTTGFDFNYDLSKEFNSNRANIYTMVSTMIDGDLSINETAGNTLPMSEQTTVVPVGVKIATNGDYTFAMPDGTNGVGVTLVDNVKGERTNLGLTDYTVKLEAGTYDARFVMEISPIQNTATGVELLNGDNGENGVRKVMIDGVLYIVRDGHVFDAQGKRIQ